MKTEIEIEEIIMDEYWLVGNADGEDFVYGNYTNLAEAVKGLKLYRKDYIKANKMKIRHHLSVFVDQEVDCAELLEGES